MMHGQRHWQVGHDLIQLRKEPVFQQTIFDEYIHVNGDTSKAEKVIRSIRRDISDEAYLYVYYASLSDEEDALQAIYQFLQSWICHRKQCIGAICESICDADRRTAEKSWKRMSSFPGICTI